MKRLSIVVIFGLCACASNGSPPEISAVKSSLVEAIHRRYSADCNVNSVEWLGVRQFASIMWRIVEIDQGALNKQDSTDLYYVKCKGGNKYFVDVPRNINISAKADFDNPYHKKDS